MRQVFIITLLLTLITSSLRGATETISLDGSWKIRTDPQNSGKQNEWFAQSIATNAETRDIQVPGVLQTVFREYHGLVWYERDFRTPENPNISNANINARTLLRFWQAEYRADVWVNGVYLGFHEGGEEAFELDATDALMPVGEQNRLTVRVLNASDEPIDGIALANVPSRNNTNTVTPGNGYASGGLVDSVELLIVPEVRITDLHLIPNWKTGEILVRAEMENYSDITQPFQLTLSAASADGGGFTRPVSFEKSAVSGKSIVEGNLTVPDFRLWELNDPNLYAVTAESKNERSVDRRTATCGFRDFRFENGFFRLNGKRIYVKCSHSGSDSPVTHRLPLDPDLYRKDIIFCKTMGFNMIRYIAGMPRRFQLDLCDRIGFMVYDECLAAWCYAPCPERSERYAAQTAGMIRRDRNHPSVVIWGLLNETIDLPLVQQAVNFLPTLRELDPDRLVLLNSGSFDENIVDGNFSLWKHANAPLMPAVIKNLMNESFLFDGTDWTANTLFLHPGDITNEYAVLKWTAPQNDEYTIEARFRDVVKDGVTTVDIHVFKITKDRDPQEIWSGNMNLNETEKETAFNMVMPFVAGDELAVVVGIGDETSFGDTTATDIKITSGKGVIYDANADYSFKQNPNGVWSYGFLPRGETPDLSCFTLFDEGRESLAFKVPGRFANPGSSSWENGLADTHPYQSVPHTAAIIDWLRNHSKDNQPVFLSEYGIGSAVNLFRLTRYYEQYEATDAEDARHYRDRYDRFMADWNRWKLEDSFISPDDFFRQAISRMADQRRIGINAIRANANVIGHSVTGTHDQGFSGEGLITIFRELKPGTIDAMADVFAPLRFSCFVEPVQLYRGDEARFEAVLINEDVLKPGDYPVRCVVVGPGNKRIFDEIQTLTVPKPAVGRENPFAIPVFSKKFPVDGPTGEYHFYIEFQQRGAAAGGSERFYVTDPADFPRVVPEIPFVIWGNDDDLLKKLAAMKINAVPYIHDDGSRETLTPDSKIIVGKSINLKSPEEFATLYDAVRSGAQLLFLSLDVLADGENTPIHDLPFENCGTLQFIPNWLYHKDDWAKRDEAFNGLPSGEVLDYLFYREMIPRCTFKDQKPEPDVAIAGAFSTQYGYDAGLSLAVWKYGKGFITLSTWPIQENLPHPVAEQMLRNLLLRK